MRQALTHLRVYTLHGSLRLQSSLEERQIPLRLSLPYSQVPRQDFILGPELGHESGFVNGMPKFGKVGKKVVISEV